MSLTILHLIPTLDVGGAERQLSLLACQQMNLGYSVHVAIRREGVFCERLRKYGVIIHVLGDYRAIDLRLVFGINKLLNFIQPNLIQTWLPQMDVIGGLLAVFRRLPWVATERASGEAYITDRCFIRDFARRSLIRRCSAVITNSIGGIIYWRKSIPELNNIFMIKNAIDHASINVATENKSKVAHSQHTILVVGRLVPSKAVDVVLAAVSMIPKSITVDVKIIGDGPIRELIWSRIQDLNIGNRVELLGNIDWWSQMAEASMLISMSRFEGQPNVVLEAMAGNCPLIVSDIPAHREILDEKSAIFVSVDNSTELASAIQDTLANHLATQERLYMARMKALDMTVENIANDYNVVYQFILKGNR